jgi:hypothetical protein
VFLRYAGAGGSAFIDRKLYVPRSWSEMHRFLLNNRDEPVARCKAKVA